jgi:hypothetical protein
MNMGLIRHCASETQLLVLTPLTMISKRVEQDEPANLLQLLQKTSEAVADAEKRFR